MAAAAAGRSLLFAHPFSGSDTNWNFPTRPRQGDSYALSII